jgi:RNA polymerase sigma-70 factor, ECF subfamily
MSLTLAGDHQSEGCGEVKSALEQERVEELLARLLVNDDRAWKQFHELYTRLIHQCIHRVTRQFMATTADDVEEIYASLYLDLFKNDKKKLRSYDRERGTKFTSWLGLLATHTAYDFLRARRRARLVQEPDLLELMTSDELDPFEHCLAKQRSELLSSFVHDLSPRDQEFIELYFCRGLSPEQVAQALGISVKTVYSKKHKIRGRLVGLMEKRQLAA